MRFWDSSAVVPLIVGQQASTRTAAWIAGDSVMVIWTFTHVEVVSALRRLVRDRAIDDHGARLAESGWASSSRPPTWSSTSSP